MQNKFYEKLENFIDDILYDTQTELGIISGDISPLLALEFEQRLEALTETMNKIIVNQKCAK